MLPEQLESSLQSLSIGLLGSIDGRLESLAIHRLDPDSIQVRKVAGAHT